MRRRSVWVLGLACAAAGCTEGLIGGATTAAPDAPVVTRFDSRVAGVDGSVAGIDGGVRASADAAPARSNIEHVILVVQENHTFDAYFGRYCTAPAGSGPACNDGPSCCEAAPDTVAGPAGSRASPVVLDDAQNGRYSPDHHRACELAEMDGGAMDRFVAGVACSSPFNFALAPPSAVTTYHGYASRYALADRYFQPIAGATSANDMYFAVARRVFDDNMYQPSSLGAQCIATPQTSFAAQTTVVDLLVGAGRSFGAYIEGYGAVLGGRCPGAPADCPAHRSSYPCTYDPSDIPFQYYPQLTDNPSYMHDYPQFALDLDGLRLPDVAFIKGIGYHSEHPGAATSISAGAAFVDGIVQAVLRSPYADSTLILITWDEGGGYFDHVPPPAASTVDGAPYGTRVPLLAIGRFARRGFVSHTTLEHSSIVKFLELNFLGVTGGLHARDAAVSNLGSVLDPNETGIVVPED